MITTRNPEWENEPNRQQWIDPATGYRCLILKHHWGHLCGYIRVMRTHRLHGRPEKAQRLLQAHGGLNFASNGKGVAYLKRGMWLGFDCAHAWDYVPATDRKLESLFGGFPKFMEDRKVYRNSVNVRQCLTDLALQLKYYE